MFGNCQFAGHVSLKEFADHFVREDFDNEFNALLDYYGEHYMLTDLLEDKYDS